ncbi:MAG: carbon-nitrogen hydrolase family protein [Planctomycetaceae bacterium]|nr:carbon-nitrogen hydrolase family protein [Planctomycetaceae bacterium]
MSIKIAVVQMPIIPGEPDMNRRKALDMTAEALAGGADIVLLPEGMLMGYTSRMPDLAEPVNGPTTQAFQSLLAGSRAMVLYGLTERANYDCYLAATLVGAGGVMAHYRKTHLWWASDGLREEAAFFKPGHHLTTFDVKGFKAGVMICYDGDFPELTRTYATMGCSMVFWMNNRGSRGHGETAPLSLANSMIMAASCPCGKDEADRPCGGGSNITGPYGNLLAEIWNDEGVIYADVDPQAALDHRKSNPWYRGRRRELYRQL